MGQVAVHSPEKGANFQRIFKNFLENEQLVKCLADPGKTSARIHLLGHTTKTTMSTTFGATLDIE